MSALEDVPVEMSIVLGSARLPIRQMLKMGRGATIPLDSGCDDLTEVYVKNKLIARGNIQVNGERMALEVTEVIGRES